MLENIKHRLFILALYVWEAVRFFYQPAFIQAYYTATYWKILPFIPLHVEYHLIERVVLKNKAVVPIFVADTPKAKSVISQLRTIRNANFYTRR